MFHQATPTPRITYLLIHEKKKQLDNFNLSHDLNRVRIYFFGMNLQVAARPSEFTVFVVLLCNGSLLCTNTIHGFFLLKIVTN